MTIQRIDAITARYRTQLTRSADDALDLRYATWQPDGAEPERYVVFMNGRTEWLEKYSYIAEDLGLPPKTGLLTWDHRGQGASGGARAYVDDFESYATDAARIVGEVVGTKPYVLMGHSLGGLISLYATLTGHLRPQALVLCSPLLGLPSQPLPRQVSRPVATALTALGFGTISSGAGSFVKIPFEKNVLTHDIELYRRMQNSPYKIPGATFGWVAATFRALDICFDPDVLAELSVPTLVMAGSDESVVDPAAFAAWVQAASGKAKADVQLRMIPGARHELLSEIPAHYEAAVAAIRKWFAPHWGAKA